jgi:SAM-dependent methyltransferase
MNSGINNNHISEHKNHEKSFEYLNDLIRAYRQSHVIFSASELGLFDALITERLTIEQLSFKLNASPRGLELLLNALCAMGIIEQNGTSYLISDNFKTFLDQRSTHYLGAMIKHEIHLHSRWRFLSQSVRTGESARKFEKLPESDDSERFINAMSDIGRRSANIFLENISFHGIEHILDLGGGPGRYVKELCEAYSYIHVTLFDKPDTINFARRNLKDHPDHKRMHYISGDFFEDPFGGPYDVILLSNVIHIFGEKENIRLLKKCYSALKPGGRILIKDLYLTPRHDGPVFTTIFALHMLLSTDKGKCYTENELFSMLHSAKFKGGDMLPLTDTSFVIEGIKTELHS